MLLWLTEWLSKNWIGGFGVFSFLTMRGAVALLTSLTLGLLLGPWMIRKLSELKYGQAIRADGPATHQVKQGTPTMGGLLILFSWLLSTLLWADLSVPYVWIAVLTTLGFGWIGWMDDWRKIVHKNPQGLTAKEKMFWQSVMTLAAGLWIVTFTPIGQHTYLVLPFFKNILLPIGVLGFLVMFYFVVVGTSNGVNLTDGLDGLAIMPAILVAGGMSIVAYVAGNAIFAKYLAFPYLPGTGELVVFLASLMGAGLAFLWFNAHPAKVFMGDVGALAIGAGLGVVAMIVRQELVLFVMCGLFVAESVSVMVQVSYFKYTRKKTGVGKRLLLMAPLHHHFEQIGWRETQVVVRFWIIAMAFVLLGLALLKIR
jgi:phospho-N-acetylmuramoyl-pentapeptide-transferase